jgi:hypothetical protein
MFACHKSGLRTKMPKCGTQIYLSVVSAKEKTNLMRKKMNIDPTTSTMTEKREHTSGFSRLSASIAKAKIILTWMCEDTEGYLLKKIDMDKKPRIKLSLKRKVKA